MVSKKKTNWYKQQINIARNQLKLEDDLYRQILVDLTTKSSLRDMSIPELVKVLEHMKKIGFKHKPSKVKKGNSPSSRSKKPNEKTMLDKLRQIWIEMNHQGFLNNGSEAALYSWASKQVARLNKHEPVAKLEWFNDAMLYYSIEQLKMWHLRLLKNVVPELKEDVAILNQEDRFSAESRQLFIHTLVELQDSQSHSTYNNAFNVFTDLLQQSTETAEG